MALIQKFMRPGVSWTLNEDILRNLRAIFNQRQGHSSPISHVDFEGVERDLPGFEDEISRQILELVAELEPRIELLKVKVNAATRPRPTVSLHCRIVATNEHLEFSSTP